MRNCLFATAGLAFVSSPAMAADMLSVGVGGYMQQWFGYADRDDGAEGGFDTQSDSEVYFSGSLESDSGLKFGVDVQLEGNNGPKEYTHPATGTNNNPTGSTNIDESFAWVSGDFGRLEIGARDSIHARTHVGIRDVGVGISGGDTHKWIPGAYHDTNGWWVGMGDNKNVIYISPRVNGVQLGVSYGPDVANESKWPGAPTGSEDSVWAAGLNFQQDIGDTSFSFSVGHRSRENNADATFDLDMDDDNMLVTAADRSMDNKMKGRDSDTFTNVGLGVGFGAFTFNVAYAMRDRGQVSSECRFVGSDDSNDAETLDAVDATATAAAIPAVNEGDTVACDRAGVVLMGSMVTAGDGTQSDAPTTGNGAVNATHMFVDNKSGAWDTWGASVTYTDGPMALSLAHMQLDADDNTGRTATMVSAAYTLAPGVAWRSSIFQVEDDTTQNLGGEEARQDVNEGTAFVTGITLSF